MKPLRIILIICSLVLIGILAGCGNNETSNVKAFELPDGSISERGTDVPYALNGVLSLPEGQNCPVVFILHGAHQVEDAKKDNYYTGFSYLSQKLAEKGFLPISINVNMMFLPDPVEGDPFLRLQAIFDSYYTALEKANSGDKLFGVDLTGKVDLSKINFIGHSRGGGSSLYLAKYLESKGQKPTSVLMVAPAVYSTLSDLYADVPTGVIVPQYDGDVVDLDGFMFYNQAVLDGKRQNDVATAFLLGANHNRFNSKLDKDTLNPVENVEYLAADQQKAFLVNYALDFLALYNFGEGGLIETLGNGLNGDGKPEVSTTLFSPKHQRLVDGASKAQTTGGLTAQNVVSSYMPDTNTAGAIAIPVNGDQQLKLCALTWNQQGGKAEFKVEAKPSKQLLLNIALDPTKCKTAVLEVTITDKAANQVTQTISNKATPALKYYDGHLDQDSGRWSSYSPLGSCVLDVSTLEDIKNISFTTQSDNGAILIESIRAVNK